MSPPPQAKYVVVNPGGPGHRMTTSRYVARAYKQPGDLRDVYFVDWLSSRALTEMVTLAIVGESDPRALFLVAYDVGSRAGRGLAYYRISEALRGALCARVGRSAYICPSRAPAEEVAKYAARVAAVPVVPATVEAERRVREALAAAVADAGDLLRLALSSRRGSRGRPPAARLALAARVAESVLQASPKLEQLLGPGALGEVAELARRLLSGQALAGAQPPGPAPS